MKKLFKITIPKPCNENWNAMSPNERGKFCSKCAKTVVDFSSKSPKEIQKHLVENKGQRICGHFKRNQLDSIVIQIPENIFYRQFTFQKLFILSLFMVMGTTLFSCKTETGKKQSIEKVELVDSLISDKKDTIQRTLEVNKNNKVDTTLKKALPPVPKTIGLVVAEKKDYKKKSEVVKDTVEVFDTLGEITVEGEIELAETICPLALADNSLRFKGDKYLSEKEARESFENEILKYVSAKFDTRLANNLNLLKGSYKMYSKVTIDSLGNLSDINIRAPHSKLKKHLKDILQQLPQFIPAKKEGKNVSVSYVIPITFVVK